MASSKNPIRNSNLKTLKRYLFERGSSLKSDMARHTGISVVTINTLVKQLVAEKILLEGELTKQPLGRPAINYHFNYEYEHFLLLSIQEQSTATQQQLIIRGDIINLAGTTNYTKIFNFSEITRAFFIKKVAHFLNLDFTISKIGLSFPGKIYQEIVVSSWKNLFNQWNFAVELAKVTPIPVLIQNDAHLLTVGQAIREKLTKQDTIVGIFYPQNSMPGITIYANGTLLEGRHHLAGEAKFLPFLINESAPATEQQLLHNLIELLTIYNVVIAPDLFIISADSVKEKQLVAAINRSPILTKQINQPQFLFVHQFQEALTYGLRWLVTSDGLFYP